MHDIQIELDVPVPMRDGTVLRANITRPAREGTFPVLLTRHPYDKNLMTDGMIDTKALVQAGYVVIHQDVRGRLASDGEWVPWKHERDDGHDTVEWAAALPYSNGRVGMFGGSYLGSTQWSAAIARAPHLRAIAPATTWSDPEDGMLFRGGAIELGLNTWWGLMTGLGQTFKSGLPHDQMFQRVVATTADFDALAASTYWQLPSGAMPALVDLGQPDLGVSRALADPSTMDEARVSDRHDEIAVPSLGVAGWFDVFLQGDLDNYVARRDRGQTARLIVGPWHHTSLVTPMSGWQVGEANFGLGSLMPAGASMSDIHREWYDHWIGEGPATAAHESGVLLFVMGANTWRAEQEWPLARAKDRSLYLHAEGELAWSVSDVGDSSTDFTYDPADPVITRGGNLVMATDYPAGPFDQRDIEARDDVLVFTTPSLERDLEITGRVRATLFASTDGPSTDWVVRLCEVDATGVSRNIVDGITRLRTEPGRVDEIEIDLWSTSIVVRAGHRLRVHVTSSSFPRWDRNLNTGEPVTEATAMRTAQQRVHHDRSRPSRVVLPVVES